ncbi:unnamed protein product [Clonostachys rosea]|uniref:Cupin type-2 domain-containing protein n=1 Tax=Bionectria ochroleuca TaxID=29856 RepID=A0ABY6USL1_BIOOC|nr:unnamed protein product [Clonostachys rosea]
MSVLLSKTPPTSRPNYIIDQLEGERISIPGSKGVFRILASSKQTNGSMAIFQSGAVLSDAPGFHWHDEAHDVFLVLKGFLKLWNGDKCRIMGPGDFAYVPPKVIHNPELLGPHTETLGLIVPGDWVDFFRYVGEEYDGIVVPENDGRDIRALLLPKVIAAKDRFDVHFVPEHQPPDLGDWLDTENRLPGPLQPYFLRANAGPRWILGGVISRPFINAEQCDGKFAITSIESSNAYGQSPLRRWMTFTSTCHCFYVTEGLLRVRVKGESNDEGWEVVREGQTLVVAGGQTFALEFGSRFVRAIVFSNGRGLQNLIQAAGKPYAGFVLPEQPLLWTEESLQSVSDELNVALEDAFGG